MTAKDTFLGKDETEDNDTDDISDISDSSSVSDISDSDNTVSRQPEESLNKVIDNIDGDSEFILNEDEEDDDTIKAILQSREMHREQPPMIMSEDFVVDICLHPRQNLIALGSITGDILIYEYSNEGNERKSKIEGHLKSCRDIEFSNDGKIVYSAGKDKVIMLTDLETERLLNFYENAHENAIYILKVINENLFASGDDNGVVKLWDKRQKTDTPIFSLKEMEDFISAMITNEEQKYLVCSSGDGSLTTLNMAARKLHVQSEEYDAELTSLGLFRRETKVVATNSKGKMYIFNWGEFGFHSDELTCLVKKSIQCMIPITENIAIIGDETGVIRATSIFPNKQLGIVGQHDFPVERLDVSHDGVLVASSSHNNDIKFWNVGYLENVDIEKCVKGGKQKQMTHNLPSSEVPNASDFFSDL